MIRPSSRRACPRPGRGGRESLGTRCQWQIMGVHFRSGRRARPKQGRGGWGERRDRFCRYGRARQRPSRQRRFSPHSVPHTAETIQRQRVGRRGIVAVDTLSSVFSKGTDMDNLIAMHNTIYLALEISGRRGAPTTTRMPVARVVSETETTPTRGSRAPNNDSAVRVVSETETTPARANDDSVVHGDTFLPTSQ